MSRFKGDVEQARKDLREMGLTAREARDRAPRLAYLRQGERDMVEKPFPWLGVAAGEGLDLE